MPSMKKLIVLAFAATVSAQASQIDDGQVQAPTSESSIVAAPVTQIDDGQVQAPTSGSSIVAPVTQIDDGQVQAPTVTPSAVVSQIPDGQVQAPTAASTGAPVPTANGTFTQPPAVPFTGGAALVTFSDRDLATASGSFHGSTPALHNAATASPKYAASLATTQPEVTYPEGGLQAWLVVLGSFSGMLAAFGLMNIIGTFQAYLITHQLADTSPSTVGWIFSLYVFLAFGCGLQIGPIFDRKGPRWLVFAGSVCLVVGMVGVSESTEYWHFLLTFSILGGVGTSLIFTPAVGAIAHFFSRRRGAATGIAATGGSFGGIIFPLALQSLFPRLGFAWSVRLLGLVFFIILAIANLLIRTRLPPKVGGTVRPDFRVLRDVTFSLTTAGVFFIEWGLFVPLSYISSYALANGLSMAFSYQLLAVLNAGSVFGRAIPGYVADRLGRFNTMIGAVALCLISVLGIWLNVGGSIAGLCVFGVLFGFASGSNISLTPVCVGQLCEPEVFGRWYGTCYTIVSIGYVVQPSPSYFHNHAKA
ncbi:MAG: hypothetical protein Q9185_000829 [Variospora sp. 1 TL-2023]